MSVEIRVPPLGESVVEATVGRWTRKEGEQVARDEVLVELETDKITVEVSAPKAGVLKKVEKAEGETVGLNDLLGVLEEGAGEGASAPGSDAGGGGAKEGDDADEAEAAPVAAVGAQAEAAGDEPATSPAVRRLLEEHGLAAGDVKGSGPGGRLTKEDVQGHVERGDSAGKADSAAAAPAPAKPAPAAQAAGAAPKAAAPRKSGEREERQRMSRRRQTIARRLVEAQQTTASLTTFNEVDLSRVMELRKAHQDAFVKKHGIKLGFMSFFTKAVIGALKAFPRVNGEIEGDEIILKNYYDIGIAVGADEGLVVPVVRDADQLTFAEIEAAIADLGKRARDGKLTMDDLQGGTFTITNGGIYGSMLSTPILNPPQVGILGMHNIVERPMVVDGEIEIRPMMYVALTYDHRIVDGSEAVRFLVAVKEQLESPERMLIEV
jgi:2-oxoglutarate dehydrogenase E2 component (dihydrolipoamide succinyltransferase)